MLLLRRCQRPPDLFVFELQGTIPQIAQAPKEHDPRPPRVPSQTGKDPGGITDQCVEVPVDRTRVTLQVGKVIDGILTEASCRVRENDIVMHGFARNACDQGRGFQVVDRGDEVPKADVIRFSGPPLGFGLAEGLEDCTADLSARAATAKPIADQRRDSQGAQKWGVLQ